MADKDGVGNMETLGDSIDEVTFSQILEMDDNEDDRDFSKSIVVSFFEQAMETFENMDQALKDKDLAELSRLGHFLKGSSATLGLTKVKDICEKIQRYGKKENLDSSPLNDEKKCLELIVKEVPLLKAEFTEAEEALKRFYGDLDL